MKKTKLRAIGNSVGIVIPKPMLGRLRVQEGDAVYLVERPDGIELQVGDPEFERKAAALREGLASYRNAMNELAK